MNADTRDAITWTLGTFVTLAVIVAAAARLILLPWLRDHLVGPVRETHRQVASNGHAHESHPTIPDRLEDLAEKVDEATSAHEEQARDVRALSRVLDQHLRWSDRWVDVVDREIDLLKQEKHHHQNGDKEP